MDEQLPDGLQIAIQYCNMAPEQRKNFAQNAVRSEFAQRIALQQRSAEQAQRIVDLEKTIGMHAAALQGYQMLGHYMEAIYCAGRLAAASLGKHYGDAAVERMQAQDRRMADMAQRIAELEVECDEWKRIASAYSTQKELAQALKQAKASGDAARKERDALRAKYDELLVALHGIGKALGIPEGDRSPYSVTCGVLERVNALAEIEAQEPVALVETSGDQGAGIGWSGAAQPVGAKLYARTVPAQAVPRSGRQRQEITLNAAQLRNALEFIAPDFDRDADQHESEVTICWREAGTVVDDDGKPEPAGYVAWLSDYPEEGCIPLLESWDSTPPHPAQAVPESVEGLVSVFCYDEVLTFTFCDEAAADKFAGRFDPSVDSAESPEHKA